MGQYFDTYKNNMGDSAANAQRARQGISPLIETKSSGEEIADNEDLDKDLGFYNGILDFFKELPMQFVGGVNDAVNNTVDFARSLGKVLHLPGGALQIVNPEGAIELKFVSEAEIEASGGLQSGWFPRIPKATTSGGAMIRSVINFVTAFIPAFYGLPGNALGAGVGLGRGMAAGGIADGVAMDPHGQRLMTLLNEIPVLNSFIPDYLADNNPKNEEEWEGRIKNIIDGLGAGVVAESIIKIFKGYKLRRLREVENGLPEAMVRTDPIQGALDDYDATTMAKAQAEEDLVASVAPEELLRPLTDDQQVFINLERITTAEDVKVVLQNATDEAADLLNAGGKTFEGIQAASSVAELKELSELLGRDIQRPFTAEEGYAARKILNASSERLTVLAREAVDLDASKVDLFNFRRALAQHNAIQEVVLAGRKATAQALVAWRIPAGSDAFRGKMISAVLEDKSEGIQRMAGAVLDTAQNGGNVSGVAANLTKGNWGDAVHKVWINGLLSSPKTHAANVISNTATTFLGVSERYMTAALEKSFGINGGAFTEANARAVGFFGGLLDGFKLITKQLDDDMFRISSKLDWDTKGISAAAWGKPPDSVIGKGLDYLGKVVSLPGWALETGDVFFKGINYRMQLHEQAAKQALREGLRGDIFKHRMVDLVRNPTEPMKEVALDFAQYQTFTSPAGAWTRKFKDLVGKTPMGKYVVPFIRTISNITRFGAERTPIALLMSGVRESLKAGGSQRAAVVSKIMSGSLLMAGIVPLVLEGKVTGAGPTNYKERRILEATGWQPYSVRVGDVYLSYSRLEPIGTLVGYSADIASIMGQLDEEEAGDLVAAGVAAFIKNLGSKTFISGGMEFVSMMADGDPDKINSFLQRFGSSFTPFSNLGRTVNAYFDEYRHDYTPDDTMGFLRSMVERAKQNIPGLGTDQPLLRDIWGNPRRYHNGVAPMVEYLSPIAMGYDQNDVVSNIIAENNIVIDFPSRVIRDVRLTNHEYSRYSELAGKMAKQQLDVICVDPRISTLTPGKEGSLAQLIKNTISTAREQARHLLIKETPGLKERIIEERRRRKAALTS